MGDSEMQDLSPVSRERIYRRNFVFFLSDGVLFTVAMGVMGTTTVIPDFIRYLTDSKVLIGVAGSLFDICWTLPQLFIARYIVRYARKKWWFAGPNIPVRFVILIFAVIVVLLGKGRPGAILVAFLICYGIAAVGDGIVGVPWADLTGTSLDARWRARMFGLMTVSAGAIMLLVSPIVGVVLGDTGPAFPNNYALIFGLAGVLFACSTVPTLCIHELPGGKRVEKVPTFAEFLPGLGHILRTDGSFRAILIARMLTSLLAMAGPFYIGYATGQLGLSSTVAVPTLLVMQTVGSMSGSFLYIWLGARNNLLYIRLALVCATCLPICALLAAMIGPVLLYIGFLLSGLALSNLFLGYQNWVVTHASPDQRPIYAGLFNTIASLSSIAAPIIGGTVAQEIGYGSLFILSLLMALCALFVTVRFVHNPHVAEAPLAVRAD